MSSSAPSDRFESGEFDPSVIPSLLKGYRVTKPLIAACFKNGLIAERVGRSNNVLKLMPPLMIEEDVLLEGLRRLKQSVIEILE